MLDPTNYTISLCKLQEAIQQLPKIDFKLSINEPSGDFFYDPWIIKKEFQNTIWEDILESLPEHKGEARLIDLSPGTCYYSHADIDDRWHLNLQGDHSFLIDVNDQKIFQTKLDGIWYELDAGKIHSAANLGNIPRIQLVVRRLLTRKQIENSRPINIVLKNYRSDYRYVFDHQISPWLNLANKSGWITDFKQTENSVGFTIHTDRIDELSKLLPQEFEIVCL